ncbi:MAG TPA: MDR family MFS transporter [Actinocrinis sp.]|uniref:MDR family MFS transporter n=1 Tax=Actinocrinis sp. TaxID=1920516 RepID=UPI002DDCC7FD|nr:MDR family MFS transporter [Actinocrinis sp.]HEV2346735.1 MDR family MFS transporter [Actinocrinis sp.]
MNAPATAADGRPLMSHRQIMVVFSGLMLGMLLAALDQTIVSTALWTIVQDLDPVNGLAHQAWVVTAYLLASTVVTPIYGKLADLYGPKKIFMFAITLFLVGSALCGMSQNMGELIAFRALQGLGGGGLMALVFTIIGVVVPPRDRGKYQGYFGGVFMLAMVLGPLIGGFFTDRSHLFGVTGWRWIFYVNLPIGIVALIVVSIVLHVRDSQIKHKIDYVGAALVAGGASALLLVTEWGGKNYAWGSPTILALIAASAAMLALFVFWEMRVATEPILPMHLFRNSVFTVSNVIAFVLGIAMMGSLIYISLYLQLVVGYSPTMAGLAILPMMFGIMPASIISGRMISRIGKYRPFPIAGTAVATVGMFLMSRIDEQTSATERGIYMFVLGAGLGLVMPVLTLAVQNALPFKDIGTGTSANLFFRNMGGSFGTAIFGALLTNRLGHYMASALGARASVFDTGGNATGISRKSLDTLNVKYPGIEATVLHSFVLAMQVVFEVAAVIMALGFVLSLFLKQVTLRSAGAPAPQAAPEGPADAAPDGKDEATASPAPALH